MVNTHPSVVPGNAVGTAILEPLVSIILPVCNGEPYISETLDSALRQTYRHIELIVVDDGSRDRTRTIVEARAAADPRVRVIVQANRGLSIARNRALEAARGEFIAPLDADDLWEPTKIEQQVRRMIEYGAEAGLVYCWWVSIDANGVVLDRSPLWRIEGDAAEQLLQVNYTGAASVPLYRRRCLELVGPYDMTLPEGCEDWDLALRVAEQFHVAVVPAVLMAYRRHRGSMSTRTGRMWTSYKGVVSGARRRQPALGRAVIRRSRDQFALYLAGVCYRSGDYGQALFWGLRALPSGLALQVMPHIIRLLSNAVLRRGRPASDLVRSGVSFGQWEMPQPVIPYDRIYTRRFEGWRHK